LQEAEASGYSLHQVRIALEEIRIGGIGGSPALWLKANWDEKIKELMSCVSLCAADLCHIK